MRYNTCIEDQKSGMISAFKKHSTNAVEAGSKDFI
jgi:hypothetical protein